MRKVLLLLLLLPVFAFGQMTQYVIGDAGNEIATRVHYMPSDGSSIIAGYTYNIVGGAATDCQAFVLKVTSAGTIAWQKTFGLPGTNNLIMDMIVTQDNNIVVVGTVAGTGAVYTDNTAAILKFNSTTGALMWQNCFRDAATTTAGEFFFGVTELTDGTGRLVAVGSHNYTASGSDALICVFQGTGALIYNEVYQISNGDELEDVCTSADGASVYICGEFVGDYKDGRVFSYTPGTTTGTINWSQYFDFYLFGSLQDNFFDRIYLSGTKLCVQTSSILDYTTTGGSGQGILTMNAADGSGAQLYGVKNSGAAYANAPSFTCVTSDHIFTIQSPAAADYDPIIWTGGVITSTVITEITSLSAGTYNPPVRFSSTLVGEHNIEDIHLTPSGTGLIMAGGTNVSSGFGNNDIYYVSCGTGLASLNGTCDTVHDIVAITNTPYTNSAPAFDTIHFTPIYSTVDTATTHFSILAVCGDDLVYSCDSLAIVPDTIKLCKGDTATIPARLYGSDSVLSYTWTPATGLSSTTILDPLLTATTSGWYKLVIDALIPEELVLNGSFTDGNTGFTSGYTFIPVPTGSTSPGDYGVGTNPNLYNTAWPAIGDHTTGTGNMLIVDGYPSAGVSFWCQNISVTPNTNYIFSYWSALLAAPAPSIEIMINGSIVGATFSPATSTWAKYQVMWNSGIATTASVCMTDLSTIGGGNDFAVDDISLEPICVDSDSVYVKVNLPDTTYAHTDTTVCANTGSITLTTLNDYLHYTWSTGSTGAIDSSIVVSGTGTYWVYDSAACAMLIDTFYVTYKPLDTTTTHTDTTVCANTTSVTLTASAGYLSYYWSTGSTTGSITVTTAGNYWVDQTTNVCSVLVDTFHVIFKPLDTTSTHTYDTVCANVTSITLTASTGYSSYYWSNGTTGGTIVVSAAGSYWVDETNDSACSVLVDTFDLTFRALPVISLGNDTGFCQGDTLLLKSIQPAGDTLLWSTGSTADSIFVDSSGTYTLTVHNGCVASASITVTVSPAPVVNLGPDTGDCSGAAIVLHSFDTYSATATYLWSDATTGITDTVTTSGTYWLQVTQGGCSGADTVNMSIVYDTFTLYNIDTAICKGNAIQVIATGNGSPQTYQWEPTAGIPNSTIITPIITPDTSATYAVFVFYPGCPTFVDSFHINVQPNPTVYLPGNLSVCDHDTLHLVASVTPQWYNGYSYSWTPSKYLDDTTASTVVFTAGDTSKIILTVTTPAGCIGVDSTEIIVYTDSFVHYDTTFTVCPGDSVQLVPLSDDPGTTYYWQPALYMSNVNSPAPWVFPLTTQSYSAIATSSYGCHDTVNANVIVLPAAVIYIPDSVTIFPGQSYQINPQTNCNTFAWFPPAGLNDAYISDPLASPVLSTKYVVTATTEWGCSVMDSISIYVDLNDAIALPNAFAPGSGADNIFKIIVNGEVSLNYFRVYNRWGNLVFSTNNINDGWDGTFNSQPQMYDVYVYEVEAVVSGGTVVHKHGNVTLIR